MDWLDRLERRFGFLAIPNLMMFVVAGQALATLLGLKDPTLPLQLILDPEAVARGQWWRLFTWVIVPRLDPLDLLMAVFWFAFLWMVGSALESAWGSFRATLYILLGVFLPAIGAMLLWQYAGVQLLLTGGYFSITLMLAYAALAPETSIYLFMILPVKMRWVAWVLGVVLAWKAFTGGWPAFWEVAFGVGNYLVFFVPQGVDAWRLRRQSAAGQKVFAQAKREVALLEPRRCVECGAGPEADLRLCTCERCGPEGRFWCQAHLAGHQPPSPPSPPPVRPAPKTPSRTKTKAAPKAATKTTKRKG